MNAHKVFKIIEGLDICADGKAQIKKLVEEITGIAVKPKKIEYVSEGMLLVLYEHSKAKYTVIIEHTYPNDKYSLLVDQHRVYVGLGNLDHREFINQLNKFGFQYKEK